jgi:methionyl-tRNA synthetase
MYTMVLADVIKRWQSLKGRKALLCTGTDEHGMKIQRAAHYQEMDPKPFCDIMSEKFKRLARETKISNDFFVRTTEPDHAEAVKRFWELLESKGHIYQKKHAGWYSVSDETFYPEGAVEKRRDPMTGKVAMASKETGNVVEWMEEPTYMFRMSDMKDKLLQFYAENPNWVEPQTKMNEVVAWVTNNLTDLSISRPRERLLWGIPVPKDASQTIYVWVDALINYITKAGFPNWALGREENGGWPADVQVIGKDILRFHAIYWPALLMAAGLPLPKRILCHAHWTMNRKKMSKSLGNVVDPFFALQRFGTDPMRFFFVYDGGIAKDSDYDNFIIMDRYNAFLRKGFGGLESRITRATKWNVRECVLKAQAGTHEDGIEPENLELILKQQVMVKEMVKKVKACMENLDARGALLAITNAVTEVSRRAPPIGVKHY